MTLQQLKYVTAVAETGTISGAAQALFLSQPSLTAAIHDLEQELNITIFSRTNRGVALTPAGDEFLGYARQVLEQTDLIEERRFRPPATPVQRVHPALFLRGGGLCGPAARARRAGV